MVIQEPELMISYKKIPVLHFTNTFFVFQLMWNDGFAGHGEHYFDYNHGNAYKEPHHAPAYSPPKPAYAGSETDERIVEAPNTFAKVLD